MRLFIKTSSFFVALFFLLNAFPFAGILDGKSVATGGTTIERFFADNAMTANIVGNMMSQKAQNKTPVKKGKKPDGSKNEKIMNYVATSMFVIILMFWGFVLCRGRNLMEYFTKLINYPLKIPFRVKIFLLMIMKILFNVRPRGGDIYAYGYAVKKACVD